MMGKDLRHLHIELFSEPVLMLGRTHWYVLHADKEADRLRSSADSDIADEIGRDEIRWWVFYRENEIQQLQQRVQDVLPKVQILKNDSAKLRRLLPANYELLIRTLREFVDTHTDEITAFYGFAKWLHEKNVVAPCVLFTYRVWGTSRRGERWHPILAETIDEEPLESVKTIAEIVLGLQRRNMFTLESVRYDIESAMYSNWDSERDGEIEFPQEDLFSQTSYESFGQLATYFEFIRNSLQNIFLEIEHLRDKRDRLKSESFWRRFILKAMPDVRTESQLWDFKETLNFWHAPNGRAKNEAEVQFCERVAAWANAIGGVFVVGISDSPREVKGIDNLENRLKSTRKVIDSRFIFSRTDFVHFQQVVIPDKSGTGRPCLVIAVAQTKEVVSVRDERARYSYPRRVESGLEYFDYKQIESEKTNISHNNFDFIDELEQFTNDK